MNPSVLTVYQCPFPKLRFGREYDGGYIIADVPNITYKLLLAGGIESDISFEEDFLKKYDAKCYAFDGTIQCLPTENNKIEFVKKNIGATNNDSLTNLHELINAHTNIFVKMDIEGGEIPWIKSLSNEQIDKFDQIVMEFHNPFSNNEMVVFNKINASRRVFQLEFQPIFGATTGVKPWTWGPIYQFKMFHFCHVKITQPGPQIPFIVPSLQNDCRIMFRIFICIKMIH